MYTADDIKKLIEMKNNGEITQEEFEERKKMMIEGVDGKEKPENTETTSKPIPKEPSNKKNTYAILSFVLSFIILSTVIYDVLLLLKISEIVKFMNEVFLYLQKIVGYKNSYLIYNYLGMIINWGLSVACLFWGVMGFKSSLKPLAGIGFSISLIRLILSIVIIFLYVFELLQI